MIGNLVRLPTDLFWVGPPVLHGQMGIQRMPIARDIGLKARGQHDYPILPMENIS